MLKCIVVDDTGTPIDRNVVKGEATVIDNSVGLDVSNYNAVGIQAIPGAVNDDKTLVLGGDGAEYNGCPNVIVLDHFFDFAQDPVANGANRTTEVTTDLVLTPCSQDLLRQVPGSAVVQYLVYNEFEQRFSTSRSVDCQQWTGISEIDTTQPDRSIFSVGVAGTLTGQTRLTPIGDGLLAIAGETHAPKNLVEIVGGGGPELFRSAAFNVHYQGDRADSDQIILP